MRAKEFLTEYRTKMFRYVKSVLPKWPDYVLKDWIYGLARGDHPQPAGVPAFNKENILAQIEYEGLSPDTEWKFVPNMKFTLDMFNPKTKEWLISRLGGNQEEIHHSAREQDKKRHITQAQLAKKEGGVRKEPILLIKHNDGYSIREGWHRTVQHFDMYPNGYTGPAYVAVAEGRQNVNEMRAKEFTKGVAEGSGFEQEAGIGIDGKSYKFKIRDLVAFAEKYPVTKVNPKGFLQQIKGRDEDPTQSMARAEKADLQYPIIVVQRKNGQLWIADGTHRAHKAILNKLPTINAKIIPIDDMESFEIKKVDEAPLPPDWVKSL